MDFTITVNVSVERNEDEFPTRTDLLEQIVSAIDSANPTMLEGGEVTIWDVEEA
jgi:hypothetical protein